MLTALKLTAKQSVYGLSALLGLLTTAGLLEASIQHHDGKRFFIIANEKLSLPTIATSVYLNYLYWNLILLVGTTFTICSLKTISLACTSAPKNQLRNPQLQQPMLDDKAEAPVKNIETSIPSEEGLPNLTHFDNTRFKHAVVVSVCLVALTNLAAIGYALQDHSFNGPKRVGEALPIINNAYGSFGIWLSSVFILPLLIGAYLQARHNAHDYATKINALQFK